MLVLGKSKVLDASAATYQRFSETTRIAGLHKDPLLLLLPPRDEREAGAARRAVEKVHKTVIDVLQRYGTVVCVADPHAALHNEGVAADWYHILDRIALGSDVLPRVVKSDQQLHVVP